MSCQSWLRSNFSRQTPGDRDECPLFGDQFDEGTATNRPQAASRGYVSISAGRPPMFEVSGRYSASKLMASLPQPGQMPPVAYLQ